MGEEYWGLELCPFVFVRGLPKQSALDVTLPLVVDADQVDLGGRWWPVPDFDGLEDWVARLVDGGGLLVDSEVRAALAGTSMWAS